MALRVPPSTLFVNRKSLAAPRVKSVTMQVDRLKRRICFDSVTGRRVDCPVREDPNAVEDDTYGRTDGGDSSGANSAPPPGGRAARDPNHTGGGGTGASGVDLRFLLQRMLHLMQAARFVDVTLEELLSGLSRFPAPELEALRARIGTDNEQEQTVQELVAQVLSNLGGEVPTEEVPQEDPVPPALENPEYHS